jgi:D-alanyl-lipoteichoic acid acyltransferase DltB (MBOAT superfamily)
MAAYSTRMLCRIHFMSQAYVYLCISMYLCIIYILNHIGPAVICFCCWQLVSQSSNQRWTDILYFQVISRWTFITSLSISANTDLYASKPNVISYLIISGPVECPLSIFGSVCLCAVCCLSVCLPSPLFSAI